MLYIFKIVFLFLQCFYNMGVVKENTFDKMKMVDSLVGT